jgi:hypothetical protein
MASFGCPDSCHLYEEGCFLSGFTYGVDLGRSSPERRPAWRYSLDLCPRWQLWSITDNDEYVNLTLGMNGWTRSYLTITNSLVDILDDMNRDGNALGPLVCH